MLKNFFPNFWLVFLLTILSTISIISNAQYLEQRIVKTIPSDKLKSDLEQFLNDLKKHHSAPFYYTSETTMHKAFDSIGRLIKTPLTPQQFYLLLKPVLARLGDGHLKWNYLEPDRITNQDYLQFALNYEPPLNQLGLKFIGDKIFVEENKSGDPKIKPGSEVLSINSISSSSIVQQALGYFFSDGYNTSFKYFLLNRGELDDVYRTLFKKAQKISVKLKSPDGIEDIILEGRSFDIEAAINSNSKVVTSTAADHFFSFKNINDSIGYLKLKTFESVPGAQVGLFAGIYQTEIVKKPKLILDLRGNTGGDLQLMFIVAKFFIRKSLQPLEFPKELIKGVLIPPADTNRRNQVNYVKYYNLNGWNNLIPFNNAFAGTLIVLTDGGTFSSASILTYILSLDERALIIGGETGGGRNFINAGTVFRNTMKYSGNTYSFGVIPFHARFPSSEKGHGVRPDISIEYSVNNYLKKDDLELERALKEFQK